MQLRDGDEAVRFGGPLEFVNEMRKFIPGNGFSDPPGLAVTPSGISASYSLTLPAIGVGIFALSNASLGAAFNLPFDAAPGVGEVQLLDARAAVQPDRVAARRRRLLRHRRLGARA